RLRGTTRATPDSGRGWASASTPVRYPRGAVVLHHRSCIPCCSPSFFSVGVCLGLHGVPAGHRGARLRHRAGPHVPLNAGKVELVAAAAHLLHDVHGGGDRPRLRHALGSEVLGDPLDVGRQASGPVHPVLPLLRGGGGGSLLVPAVVVVEAAVGVGDLPDQLVVLGVELVELFRVVPVAAVVGGRQVLQVRGRQRESVVELGVAVHPLDGVGHERRVDAAGGGCRGGRAPARRGRGGAGAGGRGGGGAARGGGGRRGAGGRAAAPAPRAGAGAPRRAGAGAGGGGGGPRCGPLPRATRTG